MTRDVAPREYTFVGRNQCQFERDDDELSREDSFGSCDGDALELDMLCESVPEETRLSRLQEIQLPFGNEGEEPYDSLVKFVRSTFHVPIVLVSLVYENIQWFKAGVGVNTNHTSRHLSMCAYTFLPQHPEVLYVPDACQDERFSSNPLVNAQPNIHFYCGVPLVTPDHVRLGALCMIEDQSRIMTIDQMQLLINVAELTTREMLKTETGRMVYQRRLWDSRQTVRQLTSLARAKAIRALWFEKGLVEGVVIVDAVSERWLVQWYNPKAAELLTGEATTNNASIEHRCIWSLVRPVNATPREHHTQVLSTLQQKQSVHFTWNCSISTESAPRQLRVKAVLAHKKLAGAATFIKLSSDPEPEPNNGEQLGPYLILRLKLHSGNKKDDDDSDDDYEPETMGDMQKQTQMASSGNDDIQIKKSPTTFDRQLTAANLNEKPTKMTDQVTTDNADEKPQKPPTTPDIMGDGSSKKSLKPNQLSEDNARTKAYLLYELPKFDLERTGIIPADVLLNIMGKLYPGTGKEKFEALLKSAGWWRDDGHIVYRNFLDWVFPNAP